MVSRRSLIGAGESFRKASYRDVSVGLQIEKLEILLCETSIEYCENDTLVQQIRVHFSGLAARQFSNKELSREELGEIVDTLKEILNPPPRLPAQLVAYIRSTIGLVRQLRGDNKCAIHAFMKALWIATSTHHDPNAEEIGLTVHRLGIVHGRNCDYNEAAILLEKALAIYRCGGMTENHPYLASATNELEELRPKLEHNLRRAVSTSGVITVYEESST